MGMLRSPIVTRKKAQIMDSERMMGMSVKLKGPERTSETTALRVA